MSATTGPGTESLQASFDSIRESLHEERRRTQMEIEAFRTFAEHVTDLERPVASPFGGADSLGNLTHDGGVLLEPPGRKSQANTLDAIETAYRTTVMSLPFYESEYGDTYEASLGAEFGSDLASALTRPDCFGPTAIEVLLGNVDRAIAERKTLVETCERELNSIHEAAAVLEPIGEEFDSFVPIPVDRLDFGALDGYRNRLLMFQERCERVANRRQHTITAQREQYDLPSDEPDIYAYLYQEFEPTHPVLYHCTDLLGDIETALTRVEWGMSRAE